MIDKTHILTGDENKLPDGIYHVLKQHMRQDEKTNAVGGNAATVMRTSTGETGRGV